MQIKEKRNKNMCLKEKKKEKKKQKYVCDSIRKKKEIKMIK